MPTLAFPGQLILLRAEVPEYDRQVEGGTSLRCQLHHLERLIVEIADGIEARDLTVCE